MSGDPKRLLDETSSPEGWDGERWDGSTLARIRADLGVAESARPAYDAGAGLARLAAAIGSVGPAPMGNLDPGSVGPAPMGGGGTAPVGGAASAIGSSGSLGIKVAAASLIAAGAMTAWVAFRAPEADRAPAAPSPTVQTVTTSVAVLGAESPAASGTSEAAAPKPAEGSAVTDTKSNAPPRPSAEASRVSPPTAPAMPSASASVMPEMQQLAEIRAALASDPSHALALADAGNSAFPRGVFGQEREVSAITALMKLGRVDEAKTRANAFIARHPESPLADSLRASVGQ